MTKERKELIVIDGVTIFFFLMVIMNAVTGALIYRWHHMVMFAETKKAQQTYGDLLKVEHAIKADIIAALHAPNWESTAYAKKAALMERGVQTYTDSATGLTFDYPADYVIDGGSTKSPVHIALVSFADASDMQGAKDVPREGPTMITFDIYSANGKSLSDWVRTTKESNFALGNGEYVASTTAEMKSIAYEWSGLYNAKALAIAHHDSVVLVTATYADPSDQILRDFGAIMSTFRFTR